MSIRNLIQGASAGSTPATVDPQGVDLDGVLDYFSRSTDLTGNTDSKTFTFSCNIYPSQTAVQYLYDSGTYFQISLNGSNELVIVGKNAANTVILNATVTIYINPLFTFHNLQVSIDLANTSNRHVRINDLACTVTWTTYTNDTINFTNTSHAIGATSAGASKFKGRLQSVFLDYTYRDLSIEANRRLFITADGKPADGWKTLSPIIGMSMKDAATAHINDYGTGANFTPNGTYATSNRGANQDNCVASYFDGVADYMVSGITGITSSKVFTFSANISKYNGTSGYVIAGWTTTAIKFYVVLIGSDIYINGKNSANTTILQGICVGKAATNRTFSISMSIDMANQYASIVLLDNIDITPIWSTFTNDMIDFGGISSIYYAATNGGSFLPAGLGELYFDIQYADLVTNNIFWDNISGIPKSVRQVINDTNITPKIAAPIDASNAGLNYGSSGNLTPVSAPYVGARGASEHWERTALYNGTTTYLTSTGLTGITDTKTITLVAHVYKSASTLYHLVDSTNSNVSISINASNQLVITAKNTAGTTILSATVTTAIANTTWTTIQLSIDLSNTANRSVYLNNVAASVTWTTYTNDTIDFTNASWVVGADVAFGNKFAGSMSLMLDNTYVDFTSEVNRLKYSDGLGYPLDLNAQVTKSVITQPALYLASRDTTNLGLNSGYGGNLTVNGTIVSGADVLG